MSAAAQNQIVRIEFTFMEYLAERGVPARPARVQTRAGDGQKFFAIVTYHWRGGAGCAWV
jgi:hypothetical protein